MRSENRLEFLTDKHFRHPVRSIGTLNDGNSYAREPFQEEVSAMGRAGPKGAMCVFERACAGHVFSRHGRSDACCFEPGARISAAHVMPDQPRFFHLFRVGASDRIEGRIARQWSATFGDASRVDHAQHRFGWILYARARFFSGYGCPDKLARGLLAGKDGGFEDRSRAGGNGGEDLHEPRAGLVDGERGTNASAG